MKRFFCLFSVAVALGSQVATGAATDVVPVDANPYKNYGPAMKSQPGNPMAVEWQDANRSAIAAATTDDVLAGFVSDDESARALLSRVKGAYSTDPLVMIQIAAVTTWVLGPEPFCLWFWQPSPAAGRVIWKKALERMALETSDSYVRTLCLQQLEICR